MTHIYKLVLLSIMLTLCFAAHNQNQVTHSHKGKFLCGTKHIKGLNAAAAMKMMAPPNQCNFVERACKNFQIIAYITRDSITNELSTSVDQIQESIDIMNAAFAPAEMEFTICKVDTMVNTRYHFWNNLYEEPHALVYNYTPNAINIYFATDVLRDGEGVGGYAYFPGGPDLIAINCDNDGTVPGGTMIHEMGHFFGLYHTFEVDFGVELADGSNCADTGDFICDTDADPDGDVNNNCEFLGPYQDPEGNWYTPTTDNWMSYYGDCRCEFTLQQYNRMVEMYRTMRAYLW